MRTMSEYMTESEERAVARWDVGSCLRMVHKTAFWAGVWKFAQLEHFIPRSSRFGSEPPSVEDNVDIWRYAILELHARNDDDDDVV